MSLSPESEAILAPLRAKVKEQVRIFYFVTFLAFLLNTWNVEALTFAGIKRDSWAPRKKS